MLDNQYISFSAGQNFSYLRESEQTIVAELLKDDDYWINSYETNDVRIASRDHELTEEELRSFWHTYKKSSSTADGEKKPRKQNVKLPFDELSDFFPNMKPKEVKYKIIEIVFAWYDEQKKKDKEDIG